MIAIIGKEYLTLKEASKRYGHSCSWFVRERERGEGPPYIQIKEYGRVLYPVIESDKWFKERMIEKQ